MNPKKLRFRKQRIQETKERPYGIGRIDWNEMSNSCNEKCPIIKWRCFRALINNYLRDHWNEKV